MDLITKIKPSVSRRNLLVVAGIVWTAAGSILAGRGVIFLVNHGHHLAIRLLLAALFGGLFYIVLFAKISARHIKRIKGIMIPYPCAFSFFNARSYLLMALMITAGILLRSMEVIEREHLYTFYISMGVPLLISAGRFFYFWCSDKPLA